MRSSRRSPAEESRPPASAPLAALAAGTPEATDTTTAPETATTTTAATETTPTQTSTPTSTETTPAPAPSSTVPTTTTPAPAPRGRSADGCAPAPPEDDAERREEEDDHHGIGKDQEEHGNEGRKQRRLVAAGDRERGALAALLSSSQSSVEALSFYRIPLFLLPIYKAAAVQYGVPWQILAAINEIETDYGMGPVRFECRRRRVDAVHAEHLAAVRGRCPERG